MTVLREEQEEALTNVNKREQGDELQTNRMDESICGGDKERRVADLPCSEFESYPVAGGFARPLDRRAAQLGSRIRQERLRLKLRRQDVAAAVGITRAVQRSHEAGMACIDAAYLGKLGSLGFDLRFVLAGELSLREGALLRRYRAASGETKRIIGAVAQLASGRAGG